MALRNSSGGNKVFVSLGKNDGPNKGKFVTKNSNKEVTGVFNEIFGDIIDFKEKEITFNNGKDKAMVVNFDIRDPEDGSIVELSLGKDSNNFRGLANVLLSLEKEKDLKNFLIRAYVKDDFVNLYAEKDDEKLGWKYNQKDLPQPDVVKVKGKDVKDYTEQQNFLYDELIEKILPIAKATKAIKGEDVESSEEGYEPEEKEEVNTPAKEENKTETNKEEKTTKKETKSEEEKMPWD